MATVIIIAVTVAFIGTFTAQFFVTGYRPETAIYGMFAATAAAALRLSHPRNGEQPQPRNGDQ